MFFFKKKECSNIFHILENIQPAMFDKPVVTI